MKNKIVLLFVVLILFLTSCNPSFQQIYAEVESAKFLTNSLNSFFMGHTYLAGHHWFVTVEITADGTTITSSGMISESDLWATLNRFAKDGMTTISWENIPSSVKDVFFATVTETIPIYTYIINFPLLLLPGMLMDEYPIQKVET